MLWLVAAGGVAVVGLGIFLGIVVTAAALLALRGAWMALAGAAHLVSGRRRVEGRVLRVRRRGDDDHPRWYVAVDDGTAPRVRVRRSRPEGVAQGATVRADVTRWLAHVRTLEVVAAAPVRPSPPDDGDEAYRAVVGGGVVARRDGHVLLVMGHLPGSSDSERDRAFEAIARASVGPSG